MLKYSDITVCVCLSSDTCKVLVCETPNVIYISNNMKAKFIIKKSTFVSRRHAPNNWDMSRLREKMYFDNELYLHIVAL